MPSAEHLSAAVPQHSSLLIIISPPSCSQAYACSSANKRFAASRGSGAAVSGRPTTK